MKPLFLIPLLAAPAFAAPAADYDCIIEAAQTVEIRSPVVGILERVHARRGKAIRQGQVLVAIESSVETLARTGRTTVPEHKKRCR